MRIIWFLADSEGKMRKRRTREHIIADLSVNHVERQALLAGYTIERVIYDYGIDLTLTTYNANGEVENGKIYFQLKATDSLRVSADGQSAMLVVDRADLDYWLGEEYPVILTLYDAQTDTAFWLHVQAHFADSSNQVVTSAGQTVSVRMPQANVVSQSAMQVFAQLRDAVISQR